MATLKHAFDANSMKGLVLKILRGTYPPLNDGYSNDMKNLISEMLNKDPKKRPSMKKVLEKDFLAERISNLIPMSIAKNELGQTFVKKHLDKPSTSLSEKNDVSNNKILSRNSSQYNIQDRNHDRERNIDINDINLRRSSNKENRDYRKREVNSKEEQKSIVENKEQEG